MSQQVRVVREKPNSTLAMNPKKFALWLFLVSIIMIFASLTSAYLVRQAEGNWLLFEMPSVFMVSTGVILGSSATMHWAFVSAKNNQLVNLKIGIVLTFVLGLVFLVTQFMGWQKLVEIQVYFAGSSSNPSGSFLYVLSGLHGVHILAGLIYLLIVLVASFSLKIHSKSMTQIEMCATFWHFLDALWVYLYFFLLLNMK